MIEKIKILFQWTKSLPWWFRLVVYVIVVTLLMLFTSYPIVSCGITQTTVNQIQNDSTSLEMNIDPNNSSSTSVSTDVKVPEI